MSQALTIFDQPALAPPSYFANTFGDDQNVQPRNTVPSLSYEGKVWAITLNGEKTRLMRRNQEGDEEPVSVFRGIVLATAGQRGRSYYAGAYDPSKAAQPDCWSEDGKVPHASVKAKQCDNCAQCPMAVKGSRATDAGKATVACSQYMLLAIIPSGKLDFTPLRLRLAITSIWDGESPELQAQGWFAWDNLMDWMRARKIPHTAMVKLKLKFDPGVAYPKVLFGPETYLTEEESAIIAPRTKDPEVLSLVSGDWTPAGSEGAPTQAAPPAQATPPAQETKPAGAGGARQTAAQKKAAAAAAALAAAQAAAAAAQAEADADGGGDEGEGEIILPGTPAASPAAQLMPSAGTAAPPVGTAVPAELQDLLSSWEK